MTDSVFLEFGRSRRVLYSSILTANGLHSHAKRDSNFESVQSKEDKMPPGFENYDVVDSLASTKCGDKEDDDEGQYSSDIEGDLVSGISKIKISSPLGASVPSSFAAHHVSAKHLNPLGFVAYNHLGNLPWGDGEYPRLASSPQFTEVTRVLGVDCEMVGVGPLQDSELGRVSLVNEYGFCILDTFAKPEHRVTGYRSTKSGIYPENLENAPSVTQVIQQVKAIVAGKILVGHSIHNDLDVLKIKEHPETRDTAVFFKSRLGRSGSPSLKLLAKTFLKYDIQTGDHSSIEDAQATLKLYLNFRKEWEEELETQRQLANLPTIKKLMSSPKPIKDINIQPKENDLTVESNSVFVRENKVIGTYASSSEYLDVQFRLLFEDFLRPLRYGVKTIRNKGHQRVQVNSIFRGVRIVLKAGQHEVRKSGSLMVPVVRNKLMDVDWEESKLFMNGSLLLISPDNFKSVKFAIIKNGPKNNPKGFTSVKVDVMFCKDGPSWVIDEDTNNFILMESPAFYEAYRHTLSYMQVMPLDKFPLKPYIVDAVTIPSLPNIMCTEGRIKKLDFQVFVGHSHSRRFANPLEFNTWPTCGDMGFDPSQYDAFKKSLTQQLSIIQGPPGTGKTFIGVETIKFLLTNPWLIQACPILVVSYTNHALDQTLEKVLKFVTETMCLGDVSKAEHLILRIGGGSKSDSIQPLTMKYKREQYEKKLALSRVIESQSRLVGILDKSKIKVLDPGLLDFHKLPFECLMQLIKASGSAWMKWKSVRNAISGNPIRWFGLDDIGLPSLSNLRKQAIPKNQGKGKKKVPNYFLFECPNLLQKILEKHSNFIQGNAFGQLDCQLSSLTLSTNLTGVSDKEYVVRWAFYLHLVRRTALIFEQIEKELSANRVKYNNIKDYPSFPTSKTKAVIVGMTTTGAVKYKGDVVKALKPKIMFVEEAAHVLEAHVVASLTEHCEQMILIGDHQQLRPMTADHDMSSKYRLDVSLMERLVRNGIDQKQQNWVQLMNQHRMRPEIARMVCPVIYPELYNDPSVDKYPNVRGCQKNIYFVDHQHLEAREKGSASFHNKLEVEFVATLVNYFVLNVSYQPSQITVIATYLAQKTLIEQKLNNFMQSHGKERVLVSTVDGYQGEENDIVILSLVRSNAGNNIGFLKTDNRVCVALSRARHGFFMVGNMNCLKASSNTWDTINDILMEMDCIGEKIPIGETIAADKLYRCPHNNNTALYIVECIRRHFTIQTFCNVDILTECSHKKTVKCHTVSNKEERPTCGLKCSRIFKCGHQCRFLCHDSDPNKHKNYKCLSKCRRVCPVSGHPCPGNHRCFATCFVHRGIGCKVKVNLTYSCGHGTQMVACHEFSNAVDQKQSSCPNCISKIKIIKVVSSKKKTRPHPKQQVRGTQTNHKNIRKGIVDLVS